MQHVPAHYPRDFPLPSASTDLLKIYVEYLDHETKVWLRVAPATVHIPAMVSLLYASHSVHVPFPFPIPQVSDSQYDMGHVVLNGVDFRCHGLTEHLYQERVEYAWLMQLHVGRIAGAFSTQQVSGADSFSLSLSISLSLSLSLSLSQSYI